MAEIKTLVVSDKQDLQTLLKELEEVDYQISVYTNLEQLTEVFKQDLYQFIILDLALLRENTLELVQQILTFTNSNKSIIWVLTDQNNIDLLEQILNLGVNDYLVWPIDKQNLKLKFLVAKKQLTTLIEHKKVEEDLKKSEKKLDLALEIANGSWWEWNCVTGQVNSHSHFGFDADEFRSYEDIKKKIHVEGRSQAEEILWKYISEKKNDFRDLEYRMQTKSGEWRWVSTNGRTVEWDDHGNPIKLIGVSLDITKYKQIEKTLRDIQDNLNRAQAVSHTGSWYLDIPNNKLEWSDETYRIFEVPPNTPLNIESFFECVHPDDRTSVQDTWQAAMAGAPYDKEHRILAAGKIKWVRERAKLEFSPDGKPLAGIGTVQDITDHKETEMRLKQFLKFFEMSLDLKCIIENGYIKELNPSFTRVLGFSKNELLAKPLSEFIFPEDRQLSLGQATILEQNQKVDEFENRYICKDGSIKWLSWNATIDSHGLRYATARDITEAKKAEAERQQLISLVERSRDFIGVADLNGKVTYLNSAALEMVGIESIEQAKQHHIFDFFAESNIEQAKSDMLPAIIKEGFWFNESRLKHFRTGIPIDVELAAFTIYEPVHNIPLCLATVTRNITERKQAEEILKASQQQLSVIYENVTGIIFYLTVEPDDKFRFISVNRAFLETTGLEKGQVIGKLVQDIIPQPSLDLVLSKYKEAIQTKQTIRWEEVSAYPKGKKYGEVAITPVFDANENVTHLIGIVHDITENKQAKEALLSINTKLLLAMDMAKLGCWELDIDSQIFTFDESLFKLYGTSSTQQGGFSISAKDYAQKFFLEEDFRIVAKEIEKAITTTDPNFLGHLEHRIIRTNGSIAHMMVRYAIVKDAKGRTVKTYGVNQDITDRKMVETALEQQRARANAIIELVSDGIISIDEHQHIIVFNRSAEKMFGCLSKDAIGQSIDKFIPMRYRSKHKEYVQEFGHTGISTRVMGEFGSISGLRANGEEFPIEASISHSELDGRKLFTVNCRDVTERKRAEEALRENEARLRAIIESEPECVKILDENGCIVDMNPAGLKMIEAISLDQVRGSSIFGLLVPEYRESFSKDVAKVFSGETIQQDFEIIGLNGRRRWMEQHAVPLWDINRVGRVKEMLAVTRDITERKQAEAALRDSERRNRTIVNALAEGIVLQDAESKILECNPSAEEILGLSYDQMIGRTSIDPRWRAIHEDGSPFPGETHPAIVTLRTGLPQSGVIMGIHKPNGTLRWISINTQPLMQEDEKLYGVVGSFHDITERKLAEEALRESEAQLREAQKIAHLGSWIIELSNNTSKWSDEMYQIFELDPEQFDHTEKSFFALLHPEDRDNVSKIYYDSLRNRTVFQVVHRILFPDARIKFIQVRGVHHYDINGYAIRSVGTAQDITERRMAEEAMIASLKEKDAMLKEIHHRVKNNLQIINSLLNIQSAQVKDLELIAAFTETKNRVRSMALLHETLYKSENFARIDLPSYVNSLCSHLCRSYGTSGGNIRVLIDIAEIELDLDRAIPIGLIINELVSNALKYAFIENNSGTIDVKLLKLDNKIALTVSDNGKGLSKEIDLHNIESLGLNLVCDLTRQLKGVIELNNNNGTIFNIHFPY